MELFFFLIFLLVLVLAPLALVSWIVYHVVRAIIFGLGQAVAGGSRAIGGGGGGHARQISDPVAGYTVRCATRGCHSINPADARFCRRCGHGLPAAHRVQVRRAAVW